MFCIVTICFVDFSMPSPKKHYNDTTYKLGVIFPRHVFDSFVKKPVDSASCFVFCLICSDLHDFGTQYAWSWTAITRLSVSPFILPHFNYIMMLSCPFLTGSIDVAVAHALVCSSISAVFSGFFATGEVYDDFRYYLLHRIALRSLWPS